MQNVRVGIQCRPTTNFQLWREAITISKLHERAMELLAQVGLKAFADVQITSSLSQPAFAVSNHFQYFRR